jgi:hypothetical protein
MIGFRSLARQLAARILQSPRQAIEAAEADEDDQPTADMAVLEEFVQSLRLAEPTAESRYPLPSRAPPVRVSPWDYVL